MSNPNAMENNNTRDAVVIDTILNADAVEFCPEVEDFMVCGTYQLEESDQGGKIEQQTRHGRLIVVQSGRETTQRKSPTATVKSTLDVSGVFDIKWCGKRTAPSTPILGHAAADGSLYLYEADRHNYSLNQIDKLDCRQDVTTPDNVALSLDWNNRKHSHSEPGVAVSMSDGSICVAKLTQTGLRKEMQWTAHENTEAWIVAFDCYNPNVMYTGADDAKLKLWDIRSNKPPSEAIRTNSRTHEAGVCTIQSHVNKEHVFATGSYDEYARIWDSRNLKQPLAQINAGGGVWRVKWHPVHDNLLLCASMHGGFTVLNYDHGGSKFDKATTLSYTGGHTSLGYGADWQCLVDDSNATSNRDRKKWTVGTASFYDHRLEVWDVDVSNPNIDSIPSAAPINKVPITASLDNQTGENGTNLTTNKKSISFGWRFNEH